MASPLHGFHLTPVFGVGPFPKLLCGAETDSRMSFGSNGYASVGSVAAPAPSFNVATLTDGSASNSDSASKTFIQNVAKDKSNESLGDRPLAAKLYVKFPLSTGYRSQASIYNLIRRARNRFANAAKA